MGKNLLILDDDPDFVSPLVKRLQWAGHATLAFFDLKDLRENPQCLRNTDVILCDFLMPGDGKFFCWRAVLEALKEIPSPPRMLLMSGLGQENAEVIRVVKKFGLCGYLAKPVDFAALEKFLV